MNNYLNAPNVTKLPNCLPTHFKSPADEVFYVNCLLASLDVHFSSKHDSITKHTLYVEELCDGILILPKYFPEIDPAYFLALEESIIYLKKHWDKDKKELVGYLQKAAIAFEAASNYYAQNPPKNFTEEKAKAIERFSVLAKEYVEESIKLRKALENDVKSKPYLLILKELNISAAKSAKKEFMKDYFQQKALSYQQAYDNLFETSVLGLGWVSSIFSRALHLTDLNLAGAILSNKNFANAHLKRINFEEADLTKMILTHSKLVEIDLQRAKGGQLNLNNAQLTKVKFIEGELDHSKFNHTTLIETDFERAILTGADFRGANLTKVNFEQSILTNITFEGAILKEDNFDRAILTDVNFEGVTFENINFGQTLLTGVNFQNSTFINVKLNEESLREANFKDVAFVEAEIMLKDGTIATFKDVKFIDVKFVKDKNEKGAAQEMAEIGIFSKTSSDNSKVSSQAIRLRAPKETNEKTPLLTPSYATSQGELKAKASSPR